MYGRKCAAHAPQTVAGEAFEPNGKHKALLDKYTSQPSQIKHLLKSGSRGKKPVGSAAKNLTPPGVPKTVGGTKVYPHFQ